MSPQRSVVVDLVAICDLGKPCFCHHAVLLDGPYINTWLLLHVHKTESTKSFVWLRAENHGVDSFLPAAKINGSCWFEINGPQLLWEFGLWAFSMHSSYNPLECFISEVRDLVTRGLLIWTVKIHFGSLGFWPFSSNCSRNPSKCEIFLHVFSCFVQPRFTLWLWDTWLVINPCTILTCWIHMSCLSELLLGSSPLKNEPDHC